MHFLRIGLPNKTISTLLIFDRDGTLNQDEGYTFRMEDVELTSFANCIKPIFKDYFFAAAIASNQSGVARAIYGLSDFDLFTKALIEKIDPNHENFFLAVACPHLPQENCECRKPRTAMLEAILTESRFNQVIMIGNSESDRTASVNAGIAYLDCNDMGACKILKEWVVTHCDHK